jgi:hypothetical protein
MRSFVAPPAFVCLLPGSEVCTPTEDRFDASEIGFESALDCDLQMESLEEVGCGPGDFNSEAPRATAARPVKCNSRSAVGRRPQNKWTARLTFKARSAGATRR